MKNSDIQTLNAKTIASLARDGVNSDGYHGYVDVTFLPGAPFVMFNNNDCSVASIILAKGKFEATSLRLWCALVRDATGVLDVGAYTGIYSLAAASNRPDLTIHAFEPNPLSLARLRSNITVNQLWHIQDHYCGISNEPGLAKISWLRKPTRTLSSGATFAMFDGKFADQMETAIVQVRSLNDPVFCAGLGARPLIKIDVEGAEVLVFKGLQVLLDQGADIIFETFSADASRKINGLLAGRGYSVYLIDEAEGRLEARERVMPCDPQSENMNQLLTKRPNAVSILGA